MTKLQWGMIGGGEGSQIGPAHRLGAGLDVAFKAGASCVITSIVGTFFVRLGSNNSIMGALYKGFVVTAILSAVALFGIVQFWLGMDTSFSVAGKTFTGASLLWCGIVGLLITGLIIWVTE